MKSFGNVGCPRSVACTIRYMPSRRRLLIRLCLFFPVERVFWVRCAQSSLLVSNAIHLLIESAKNGFAQSGFGMGHRATLVKNLGIQGISLAVADASRSLPLTLRFVAPFPPGVTDTPDLFPRRSASKLPGTSMMFSTTQMKLSVSHTLGR